MPKFDIYESDLSVEAAKPCRFLGVAEGPTAAMALARYAWDHEIDGEPGLTTGRVFHIRGNGKVSLVALKHLALLHPEED